MIDRAAAGRAGRDSAGRAGPLLSSGIRTKPSTAIQKISGSEEPRRRPRRPLPDAAASARCSAASGGACSCAMIASAPAMMPPA